MTVIKVRRIQKEAIESYDRKIIEIRERLKHDISVPDEDLEEKMLEEANSLRIYIQEEVEEKVRRLNERVKGQ